MTRLYGTTWLVYTGTLYALTPLSLIGSVLNIAAYLVLCRKPFYASTIFKYLRLNVLNSLLLSVLLMTRFITTVYKFDFTNSYSVSFYSNFFYAPFVSIFYLNGNLLESFITIERILKVHPNKQVKKMIKLKHFWIFVFVLSVVINLPSFFLTKPGYVDIMLGNSNLVRNFYNKQTEFSMTALGKILTYLMFFIRDFITLVIKIGLNLISILLIKKYINKISASSTSKFYRTSSTIIKDESNNIATKKAYITKIDKNLTFIAVIMSVLSSFENLFFIVSYIYLVFSLNQIGWTLYFLSNFMVALKHISNLFILYFFNNLFKDEFKKLFCCNKT